MRFLFLLFFRGHIMLVQMACQSAQVQCAQTNVLCPHLADPANHPCPQVFVLELKSFTITVTVSQAGRLDQVRKDKMEFSSKRLRKYYKNMSHNIQHLKIRILGGSGIYIAQIRVILCSSWWHSTGQWAGLSWNPSITTKS